MGEVYEARHARLPGRFAVKVLAARVAMGSPDFRRFRREAEIASALRHPNLVQVVDFNLMADGSPYIVMEFLDGSDLARELRRVGRLSPRRTSNIVCQVAGALAQAHAGGVVHRDLKPQNVFLVPASGSGRRLRQGGRLRHLEGAVHRHGTTEPVDGHAAVHVARASARPDAGGGRPHRSVRARAPWPTRCCPVARRSRATACRPSCCEITSKEPPPLGLPFLDLEVESVLRRGLAKAKDGRFATILEFSDALDRALVRSSHRDSAPRTRGTLIGAAPATRIHATVAREDSGTLKPAVSTARRILANSSRRRVLVAVGAALPVIAVGVAATRLGRDHPAAPHE